MCELQDFYGSVPPAPPFDTSAVSVITNYPNFASYLPLVGCVDTGGTAYTVNCGVPGPYVAACCGF